MILGVMAEVVGSPEQPTLVPTMTLAMNEPSGNLPPTRPPRIISHSGEEMSPLDEGFPFIPVKEHRCRSGGSSESDSTIISQCKPRLNHCNNAKRS